jgi:hypothetical protein
VKADRRLGAALFSAKPARQRTHKAEEIFQMRNNAKIREACTVEGYDSINEESMAPGIDDWVDEDNAVQVARVKAAASARMRIRNRVVRALFAEASEEELAAIADVMEAEKAGETTLSEERGADERTPEELHAWVDLLNQ